MDTDWEIVDTTDDLGDLSLDASQALQLAVDGRVFVLREVDPMQPLAQFLRDQGYTSVKIGCGEGGCGACTVLLSRRLADGVSESHVTANACLRPLASCHGLAVTTSQGVAALKDKLHPIQERLAKMNGSQCGYCSPGFVMQMYGLVRSKDGQPIGKQEVERNFDGNLCRCTGYRNILRAMRTFASRDVDDATGTQDNGAQANGSQASKACSPSKCASCTGTCTGTKVSPGSLPDTQTVTMYDMEDIVAQCQPYDPSAEPMLVPDALVPACVSRTPLLLRQPRQGRTYVMPLSLLELEHAVRSAPDAHSISLVAGHTRYGIDRQAAGAFVIDVSRVAELLRISKDSSRITVGSAVSLTRLMEQLQHGHRVFQAAAEHLRNVANSQVRNVGTVAGNLMLVKTIKDFPSDVWMLLAALGASVRVGTFSSHGRYDVQTLSLGQLFALPLPSAGGAFWLVQDILIPEPSHSSAKLVSQKVALRSQNAHAITHAVMVWDEERKRAGTVVVFGGVGAAPVTAHKAAAVLDSSSLTTQTLHSAMAALADDLHITRPSTKDIPARDRIVYGLFFRLFLNLLAPERVPKALASAVEPGFKRELADGVTSWTVKQDEWPVNKWLPKHAALAQATGDARYTDDAPVAEDGLIARFVLSHVPHGKVTGIDAAAARRVPGVVAVLSAKDIPGKNQMTALDKFLPEIGDEVVYNGQPIAVVYAESREAAAAGVAAVKVSIDPLPWTTDLDEAIRKGDYFPDGPLAHIKRGDVDAAMKTAPVKIKDAQIRIGGQAHFYMEPQTAYAVPDEDDRVSLYTATQMPADLQEIAGRVLARPQHKLNVVVRRCGGGFGGKATYSAPTALATALGAVVTRRPVRMQLTRNEDFASVGKRHAVIAKYSVGCTTDGRITALDVEFCGDGGCSFTTTGSVMMLTAMCIDGGSNIDNYRVHARSARTNKASNTAMRTFGAVQGTFIAESIVQHVAETLNLAPEVVRQRNLYKVGDKLPWGPTITPDYSLPTCISKVIERSQLATVRQQVQHFNVANRWRKRGVALSVVKYPFWYGSTSAKVAVYPDGTIRVTQGGVELGQGLYTVVRQSVAYALSAPLDLVLIGDTTTNEAPDGGETGGSQASSSNVAGAMLACATLNERLKPYREKTPSAKWTDIIAAAHKDGVDLVASVHKQSAAPVPSSQPMGVDYINFGAAVSEVEVDLLTGQVNVRRVTINYDCGISMNPAVDLGQVEGGFVQGTGLMLSERLTYSKKDGAVTSDGTWEYKPPASTDIAEQVDFTLTKNHPMRHTILSSKATGEPPLTLSVSVLLAVREALRDARRAAGLEPQILLDAPATVTDVVAGAATHPSLFTLDL